MTGHEHPNVALAREGFDAFMRGDFDWMNEHIAEDVVWHVGGNSKWAGAYEGATQSSSSSAGRCRRWGAGRRPSTHTTSSATTITSSPSGRPGSARDGPAVEWKYSQIFHIKDGKVTEVWGMAENDAAVDPYLDSLPD